MVKVNAPAMSLDASGSLAGALVFSKWKGRNYIRSLVRPANPRSGPQVGFRSMLAGLSKSWANLAASRKASWDDLAAATIISPFNAFVQFNQQRWAQYKAPVVDPTDTDEDATHAGITSYSATGGIKSVVCSVIISAANQGWGWLIHRPPTAPYESSNSTLVHAQFNIAAGTLTWIDRPLAVGTYYYDMYKTTIDGGMEMFADDIEATVT